LLRDARLDTNVVTQNKNKLRAATLILTFSSLFFLSFVLSFLSSVSATRTFFFSSKIFFEQQELLLFFFFCSFFLSLFSAATQGPCTQDFGTN
jgi:hypothetical protein